MTVGPDVLFGWEQKDGDSNLTLPWSLSGVEGPALDRWLRDRVVGSNSTLRVSAQSLSFVDHTLLDIIRSWMIHIARQGVVVAICGLDALRYHLFSELIDQHGVLVH